MYKNKNKNQRKLIILFLLVAISGISIGLATFSQSLTIRSSTNVKPNPENLKISISNRLSETQSIHIDPVFDIESVPEGDPIPALPTAVPAVISGNTISNINANFTEPGQIVTFNFYVNNVGKYKVYANNFRFLSDHPNNAYTTGAKCTAKEGATDALVQEACKCINAGVVQEITDDNYMDTLGFTKMELEPGQSSKKVSIIVVYSSSCERADGPFDVEIADYQVEFSTVKK